MTVVCCGRNKKNQKKKKASSKSRLENVDALHLHPYEKKRLLESYDTFDDYLELGT